MFRTATLRSSTIDELISYTPTGGTAANWAYDSDTDTGITLEEWAFTGGELTLPFNMAISLNNYLQGIYSSFVAAGSYVRTNASGNQETVTYGGEFVSQTALLTIHVGLQEMSIPLNIVNVNGQVRHLLVDQYPVDVAFTPRRISSSHSWITRMSHRYSNIT